MPHTKEELTKMINLDEPDYPSIVASLTADDVPILIELSKDPNPAIATKAISCLGQMNTENALTGVQAAAAHANPVYRVAAAHALRHMSKLPAGVDLLGKMLDDTDIGVKKFALKSVEQANISSLRAKVQTLNATEPNEGIKALSHSILQKLK